MSVGTGTGRMLLRRGLALEFATLAWNVAGTAALVLAAVAASHAWAQAARTWSSS